jgi:hypothetical protein
MLVVEIIHKVFNYAIKKAHRGLNENHDKNNMQANKLVVEDGQSQHLRKRKSHARNSSKFLRI